MSGNSAVKSLLNWKQEAIAPFGVRLFGYYISAQIPIKQKDLRIDFDCRFELGFTDFQLKFCQPGLIFFIQNQFRFHTRSLGLSVFTKSGRRLDDLINLG